jgi:AcrR family transcriptional regulator
MARVTDMPEADKRRRRTYDSPRRREQAAATRELMLEAAQRLFERDGYAGTSMAAIAKEAGVALKTVYLAFETKSGTLRAVWHRQLRGEAGDIPVGQQAWFRQVLDEPDPARKLQLNAANSRMVKERAGRIMEVIRAAAPADPAIAALWDRIQTEFHANQREVVESLAASNALKPELDVAAATDILWALNHPTLYQLLTRERDWTPERFEQWLASITCDQLLARER